MSKTASYEGQLIFRAAQRGVYLADMDGQPYLDEWLHQQLGDPAYDITYWGGTLRVRLTVELLEENGDG